MSVQFGMWNTDGRDTPSDETERADALLARYAPDGRNVFSGNGVGLLFRAFHTTQESHRAQQPWLSETGAVVTWEGRLDNRQECIASLNGGLEGDAPATAIVAALYERWDTRCFARLVGDWALSLWLPKERALILASDPLGIRRLYYSSEGGLVRWCSVLDPLADFDDGRLDLDEEYLAGWLAFFPDAQLTPYKGIRAVPPSCFVRLERGRRAVQRYWDFDPSRCVRCRSDAEYEEHFRGVFAQAVKRRLNSEAPILAELSGGMDSSSIVCMADTIMARGNAPTPRLDTLSYYNDSEPNWNERPYFGAVEQRRGRCGCHIRVEPEDSFRLEVDTDELAWTPGAQRGRPSAAGLQFGERLRAGGYRVVLSGIGGDEVSGGVPTPTPELAELLAAARFRRLAHQLKAWALNKRKPWFHLLWDAVRGFVPPELIATPSFAGPAPWIRPDFCSRHWSALRGYPHRLRWFGPLASFQQNQMTLDSLRRQLACSTLPYDPPYEVRYPFLDRDLLEFLYAIPREQLVRPGQRRSLLRRALAGTVPDEVLNRRRKAFVVRAPIAALSAQRQTLTSLTANMISASMGIVDEGALLRMIERGIHGQEVPMVPLLRTMRLELWLRALHRRGHRGGALVRTTHASPPGRANNRPAPDHLATVQPADMHANLTKERR
ncbi:MAG: asparagine synthase-related protein [Candidatus Acidiferrales bacterium]